MGKVDPQGVESMLPLHQTDIELCKELGLAFELTENVDIEEGVAEMKDIEEENQDTNIEEEDEDMYSDLEDDD